MEPFLKCAGALEDSWQQREHRRRVSFLTGRLSGRQSDFALRHGQPRHRVHHQQDILALIAKIFGHRQRDKAGADAQRRWPVGGGHHHHRAAAAFRPQFVIEKRAHLAIALADQGDHADVGVIVPRHRAEKRALADAAASEDSDALPFAARQQTVDGADAGDQRFDDVLAL